MDRTSIRNISPPYFIKENPFLRPLALEKIRNEVENGRCISHSQGEWSRKPVSARQFWSQNVLRNSDADSVEERASGREPGV